MLSEKRMEATIYIETAKGYLNALEIIVESIDLNKPVLYPIGLLASQAIELSLKAYLLSKGWTEKQLKQIGHDLGQALEEAVQAGLRISPSNKFSVQVLSLSHDSPYLFRYPQNKVAAGITEPSILCQDVRTIIETIENELK
jgi:hypothetical protein